MSSPFSGPRNSKDCYAKAKTFDPKRFINGIEELRGLREVVSSYLEENK
jgi:hypothetical protein